MNIRIVLVTIFVLTLLVACGPAAPSGQTGGTDQTEQPTPTPINQDDGPTGNPTPDPTATSSPPPEVTQTGTPKPVPTKEPTDRQPEPTRHPGDPKPQPKPTPTSDSLPTFESAQALQSPPVPPNGIADCYAINLFSSTAAEMEYSGWCTDELVQDVIANCAGIGDSEDEIMCGQQRLTDVQSYSMREVVTPCFAISDEADRLECANNTFEDANTHLRTFWSTWAEILRTVDSNDRVKAAKVAMADCVEQKGFARPAPDDVIGWQEFKSPDAPMDRNEPDLAVLEAIDQCALAVGLYTEQEEVWLSEISRLNREDREKVRPLIENGILPALEAEGPAPFLTLRK